MKKITAVFLIMLLMFTGCASQKEIPTFSDIRDFDFYVDAVDLCMREGYFDIVGDKFGPYDVVTLEEMAGIAAKLAGSNTKKPIEYVLSHEIAQENYDQWGAGTTRAQAAYMIAHATELDEINPVIDGAISDVENTSQKDEIYHLYRAGIFSGDKITNAFRPEDYIVRSEVAIIIERVLLEEKRVSFSMDELSCDIIAVGDVIGHMPVINSCVTETGFDFTPLFENIKKYIDESDIACVNQETVFTDGELSGYPAFGSPKEMGEAELEVGFDVVTHATNHAFDKGEAGVLFTKNFWKDKDIKAVGIHDSLEDSQSIVTIERNGIKIALLNYAYSLNGYSMPKTKTYLVDILEDEAKISRQISEAKSIADAVIVFAHFGTEYRLTPDDSQKKWAKFFADEGVLALVGTHPHVVEPMEIVTSENGNRMLCYYSLGNCISSQNDLQCALGAMAEFTVVKSQDGVRFENEKITPLITHMEKTYYSVYKLEDYTEEMEKRHRLNSTHPTTFSKEALGELFISITGKN